MRFSNLLFTNLKVQLKNLHFSHSTPSNRNPQFQQESKFAANEDIRAKEVRLVDEEGRMLGVYPTKEALSIASTRGYDLVLIVPYANPPVAKIVDYGKFIFEQQKKEKQQRKQQQQQQLKELRFKWRTDVHDFNFKVRHARQFLIDGNKVKGTVVFRGREIMHQEIGEDLLSRFVEALSDVSKVDQPIKSEGKRISVLLAPDKVKIQQYERAKSKSQSNTQS